MSSEYEDSLAVVAYHRRVTGDTLSPEYVAVRESLYSIISSPSTVFDGVSGIVQTEDTSQNYPVFSGWIIQRRNDPPKVDLTMETTSGASTIDITLNIVSVDSIEDGDYRLFFVLYEDSVHFAQSGAPESTFNFVVRKLIPNENGICVDLAFPDSLVEQVHSNLDNHWVQNRLGLVAFVQNIDTKEVLQAVVKRRVCP